ncbi:MAG: hypothetical protein DMD87_06810 [Candidatus Rokuibacteriota bacterium]|nr:MAG: hypothetical protein DMD87_06810 [Candidatus Rokubacteria bacterium]
MLARAGCPRRAEAEADETWSSAPRSRPGGRPRREEARPGGAARRSPGGPGRRGSSCALRAAGPPRTSRLACGDCSSASPPTKR